jgi:hypothetical protein
MKHHVHQRHLKALAVQQNTKNFQKNTFAVANLPDNMVTAERPEVQTRTLIQLKRRTGSWHSAVQIVRHLRHNNNEHRRRKKTQKHSRTAQKGKSLMHQIVAKPPPSLRSSQQEISVSAIGLNAEICYALRKSIRIPEATECLSFLHRLRMRDSPNINFMNAFQAIAVDNEKSKISMLQWKSTMAACFKRAVKNECMDLLETLFHQFETMWEGHHTGLMDVRYPVIFLRVRSIVHISSNPTSISGNYSTKLSTVVPLLLQDQETRKISKKVLFVVWNVLCWQRMHTTGKEFNQALHFLVPHLSLLIADDVLLNTANFQKLQKKLTKYQCRTIAVAIWSLASGFERCSYLVNRLVASQEKFIKSFAPMRLSTVEMRYRFNKIRPVFRAWRNHYDWVVAVRLKVLSVQNARRRKALWHYHRMVLKIIAARNYYNRTIPLAARNWLFVSFHRIRRITMRLRSYKLMKLMNMSNIFFKRVHVPNCFRWWVDVHQEDSMLVIAKRYETEVVRKHWFLRFKKYVRRQVQDRKIDAMRKLFQKQEKTEALRVDAENTFFLSQQELEARTKRQELHNKKLEEVEWQRKWDIEIQKAEQGRIRIHQARERIAHRAETQKEAKQHRSDVWSTMEESVLPRVAAAARKYCQSFNGKKFIKSNVAEMFRE